MIKDKLFSWLPHFRREIWILAAGRLLSHIGSGFTLFYAPIFFVNVVGLSAQSVGIAIGSASISGIVGRFLGGMFADSTFWGRKRTLLLAAAISAWADVMLALSGNFPSLLFGNLLMGLGMGLYWPATEAIVADLTNSEQRKEAFAITRLADSIGLGIGVILGGTLIATAANYRALFVIDGISFLVFFGVIYFAIAETHQSQSRNPKAGQGWLVALRDRRLLVFALANIFFTTYLSQIQTTLPLYFRNFVHASSTESGFSANVISILFTWHVVFTAIAQLPVARFLKYFRNTHALVVSILLWGVGFILVWVTGSVNNLAIIPAISALSVFALATVAFTPASSALVVEIAPDSLRGIYFSISSQCWAIGYFIGPTLGGWVLDRSADLADAFWLAAAATILLGILTLQYLDRICRSRPSS
ncbi:MAG: MFS transporter [Oscillatoria sp. PMC 1068.18]|nr:MFS transporter [Oscillatoria sp. PMC 1076.18]MEC4990546.1 MFS transporter [Oscillatoria sp. PMC 1068.18]